MIETMANGHSSEYIAQRSRLNVGHRTFTGKSEVGLIIEFFRLPRCPVTEMK